MGFGYICDGCRIGPPVQKEWVGRCPRCGGFFNTRRKSMEDDDGSGEDREPEVGEVMSMSEAIKHSRHFERLVTGLTGFDDLLGGGIVPGAVFLLCGDPGAGKTTILLQALGALSRQKIDVLYITGEQSPGDIGLAAKRLGKFPPNFLVVREKEIGAICALIEEHEPKVAVIDSIQMVELDEEEFQVGSAASIKEGIRVIADFAKGRRTAIFVIGHITKTGGISGPRMLEHHVDVVMFMQRKAGDRRILTCEGKNRFGKTGVDQPYDMTARGLVEAEGDDIPLEEGVTSIPIDKATLTQLHELTKTLKSFNTPPKTKPTK